MEHEMCNKAYAYKTGSLKWPVSDMASFMLCPLTAQPEEWKKWLTSFDQFQHWAVYRISMENCKLAGYCIDCMGNDAIHYKY